MNILITGATGFVGRNLVEYLKEHTSHNIILLERQDLISGNAENINKADAIIHLAGKAHDLKNASDPEEYFLVNYELTKKLYDNFIKADAHKFIFMSSVKAAADSVPEMLTENHLPDPQTAYGKSKLMAEEYINAQPLAANKHFFILRPCMIHGPENKGNLNLLYQFVKRGVPYPLAAFNNKRSFLSVGNLCFVVKEILENNNIESGTYLLADDEPISTTDLVKVIANSIGKKAKLWNISESFMRAVAKIGGKMRLPLNEERLNKLTENYCVSNQKIKSAIKKELPLSSTNGLKITIKSFENK